MDPVVRVELDQDRAGLTVTGSWDYWYREPV